MKTERHPEHLLRCFLAAFSLLLALLPDAAFGHTPSETYFSLKIVGTNLSGRWDVALRDLHQGMGLEPATIPKLDPSELQRREEALALDTMAGLELKADDEKLKLEVTDYTTLPLNGVQYARLIFEADGIRSAPNLISIDAQVVFRIDTNMHGLLRLDHDGRSEVVAFESQHPAHHFEVGQSGGRAARWLTFVVEGI